MQKANLYAPVEYINPKYSLITKSKAVFLDRDGTIHKDKVMTHRIGDLDFFSDTFEALRLLQNNGFLLIIVTNQNGIRDGVYSFQEMHAFHQYMRDQLLKQGIEIAAIYYSPYNSADNHISYKPSEGMFLQGINDFHISRKESYTIGDQLHDVIASERAGIKGIMVTTGLYGEDGYQTELYKKLSPITFANLLDASRYIVSNMM